MPGRDDLQHAVDLLAQGRRQDAATELLRLERVITSKALRLQLIDVALSAVDQVQHNDLLIRMSTEGIEIARQFRRKDVMANFMGRKSELLMHKLTLIEYHRKNIKLAPGWFGFVTEAEKKKYEMLSKEADDINNEIGELLSKAVVLAEQSGNATIQGHVLMARGAISSARYITYKMEHLVGTTQAKLWTRFEFLRYPLFEQLFIFPGKQGRNLQCLVSSFIEDYSKAANIFEEVNDGAAGYAYCNLANHLRSAYRFRTAKKYLKKAKAIAEKHNDLLLKRQTELLEETISEKNRDIPDYINGETRNDS